MQKTKLCPISFKDGTCGLCGARRSIHMIDKFNRETKNMIYPVYKMRCNKCGEVFLIDWKNLDDTSGDAIPYPVSKIPNINRFVKHLTKKASEDIKPEDIYQRLD